MPEHLRVAEVVVIVLDYRIAFIRGECLSTILAVGNRLLLGSTGGGIYGYKCIGTEASSVVLVTYGRTGENHTKSIWLESYWLLFPMKHVGRSGMSPAEVAPTIALRVILIIEMIRAIYKYHSVGIVNPVFGWGVMYLRTIFFVAAAGYFFTRFFWCWLFRLRIVNNRIVILLEVIVRTSGEGSRHCSGYQHYDAFTYLHTIIWSLDIQVSSLLK